MDRLANVEAVALEEVDHVPFRERDRVLRRVLVHHACGAGVEGERDVRTPFADQPLGLVVEQEEGRENAPARGHDRSSSAT